MRPRMPTNPKISNPIALLRPRPRCANIGVTRICQRLTSRPAAQRDSPFALSWEHSAHESPGGIASVALGRPGDAGQVLVVLRLGGVPLPLNARNPVLAGLASHRHHPAGDRSARPPTFLVLLSRRTVGSRRSGYPVRVDRLLSPKDVGGVVELQPGPTGGLNQRVGDSGLPEPHGEGCR